MSKLSVRSSGRFPVSAAGGGKKGARWAALVEESSDSEEEACVAAVVEVEEPVAAPTLRSLVGRLTPDSLAAALAEDPLYIAMSRGDVLWGDICMSEFGAVEVAEAPAPVVPRALPREPVSEDVFWAQPWADRLEMNGGDHYDTRTLSDEEWADCMTWLYANGWYIWEEGRQGFSAVPDTLPPRVWIPPRPAAAAPCCGGHKKEVAPLSAPGSDTGRRRAAPRPIFCGGGERCKEGCPYVHGDTIPVINALCQFGDACSKRAAAVGGTPCCRLHPDEGEWNASMVRHRPT
jgi:hypothetical protein